MHRTFPPTSDSAEWIETMIRILFTHLKFYSYKNIKKYIYLCALSSLDLALLEDLPSPY